MPALTPYSLCSIFLSARWEECALGGLGSCKAGIWLSRSKGLPASGWTYFILKPALPRPLLKACGRTLIALGSKPALCGDIGSRPDQPARGPYSALGTSTNSWWGFAAWCSVLAPSPPLWRWALPHRFPLTRAVV